MAEALSFYLTTRAADTVDPARIAYAVEPLLRFFTGTLSAITPQKCKEYATHRGVSNGTIRRELGILTAAQNVMVKERRLTYAVTIPMPPKPEPKDRFLTRSEAARLLNEARKGGRDTRTYLPLFVLIGLYTGARKEAILSLEWSQVSLERNRINFAIPGRQETKKRRSHIPIPRRLKTFLVLAKKRGGTGTVIQLDGQPIQRIDKGFRAAAKRADLVGVSPHTLRHTCGTWMAQAGVPLWDIAGWLKQDVETTQRHYAHHHPDYMSAALKSLDGK